jgi:hypothetical protein
MPNTEISKRGGIKSKKVPKSSTKVPNPKSTRCQNANNFFCFYRCHRNKTGVSCCVLPRISSNLCVHVTRVPSQRTLRTSLLVGGTGRFCYSNSERGKKIKLTPFSRRDALNRNMHSNWSNNWLIEYKYNRWETQFRNTFLPTKPLRQICNSELNLC